LINSEKARIILESLKNSAREDVRNGVKVVLTHLNSSPMSGFAMTLPSNRTAYSTGQRGKKFIEFNVNVKFRHADLI
jgi:hypothetical protein